MSIDWDAHLQPPDEPDIPECPECENGCMEYDAKRRLLVCDNTDCRYEMSLPEPEDPGPDGITDIKPQPHLCRECGTPTECIYCSECANSVKCPHGRILSDGCGACDVDSDRAYDASREDHVR